jgi:hypothetical protein
LTGAEKSAHAPEMMMAGVVLRPVSRIRPGDQDTLNNPAEKS